MLAIQTPVQSSYQTFQSIAPMLRARYGANAREQAPGRWAVEVMTGHGRSHVAHLYFQPAARGEGARFVVRSLVTPLPHRFDLEDLLRRNAVLDVGAICIEDIRNESGRVVPFLTCRASHRADTLDPLEILEMIEHVARIADGLERDICACDVY